MKYLLSIFFLLFLPFGVFAAVPFSDNFDTYTDGAINGQGGWKNTYIPSATIQGTDKYQGAKAVSHNGESEFYRDNGDIIGSGGWSFWQKGCGSIRPFGVHFYNQSGSLITWVFKLVNQTSVCQVVINNNVVVYTLPIADFDSWQKMSIDWDGSLGKHRVRVEGQDWSAWYTSNAGFTGIKGIHFEGSGQVVDNLISTDYVAPNYQFSVFPTYPPTATTTIIIHSSSPILFTGTFTYQHNVFVVPIGSLIVRAVNQNGHSYENTFKLASSTGSYSVGMTLPEGVYNISYVSITGGLTINPDTGQITYIDEKWYYPDNVLATTTLEIISSIYISPFTTTSTYPILPSGVLPPGGATSTGDIYGLSKFVNTYFVKIKERFPFSWFFGIYDIWQAKTIATLGGSAIQPIKIVWTLPTFTKSSQLAFSGKQFTLFDLQGVQTSYSTQISTLRSLFEFVLWLGLLMYVILEVRRFVNSIYDF